MTRQRERAYSKQFHRAIQIHLDTLQREKDFLNALTLYRTYSARYLGQLIGDPFISYTRQNLPSPVMTEFYYRNVTKGLILAAACLMIGIIRGAIVCRKSKAPNWYFFFLSPLTIPTLIFTITLLGAALGAFPYKGHCPIQSLAAGIILVCLTLTIFFRFHTYLAK